MSARTLLLSASLALPVAALSDQLNIKLGLWEIVSTSQVAGVPRGSSMKHFQSHQEHHQPTGRLERRHGDPKSGENAFSHKRQDAQDDNDRERDAHPYAWRVAQCGAHCQADRYRE